MSKSTAMQKWIETCDNNEGINGAMVNLTSTILDSVTLENNQNVALIEKFISSLYSQGSESLDDARLYLFQHKGTPLTRLPMTSHTFKNKLKRSMYQASLWAQSLQKIWICLIPRTGVISKQMPELS